MKIVIVCRTEFNPLLGGVEAVSLVLAEAFRAKGHEVVLLSGNRRKESYVNHSRSPEQIYIEDFADDKTWPVESLANLFQDVSPEVLILESLYEEVFALGILEACRRCEIKTFSVIHNHPQYMLRTVQRARFLEYGLDVVTRVKLSIKYLLRGHYYKKEYSRCRDLMKSFCEGSTRLIFLSEKYIKLVEDIYKLDISERSTAIPNPVRFEGAFEYREEEKENIVLFVGRFDNFSKRVDRLLKIWKKSEEELTGWKLVLIGDGYDKDRMERLSRKLKIENVVFTGSKDPTEEYKKAKIFCMTSDFEGFSMVLMEAQHFGCVPIVLNRFETAEEVIKDGFNGFLPETEEEYVNKLIFLANHDDERKRMAANIPEIIESYSIESIAKRWLDEIENCLSENS